MIKQHVPMPDPPAMSEEDEARLQALGADADRIEARLIELCDGKTAAPDIDRLRREFDAACEEYIAARREAGR